ncbi:hypothetical protein MKW98_018040 [Papaver atlanticum]|uniref:Uncharacterized protein n=1 Tax=Papaver atlanticum TaxID=357466 RepID=A0AAD4XTH0_9MAGN|nr:hypothetical protein MKW98_018040 [Papaver atlanticum]
MVKYLVLSRRVRRVCQHGFLLLICSMAFISLGILMITSRSVDPSSIHESVIELMEESLPEKKQGPVSCATVEEMGEIYAHGHEKESLRVREIIRRHFELNGASRIRGLPAEQFCKQGFVLGKAYEAGFGNEMYKILTNAALSIMLNRSLIIGQTRHILKFPFGDYISYSNVTFTLKEVKYLWIKNDCQGKYGINLEIRVDDFKNTAESNVLCSNWRNWRHPIIWFQGTTDAMGIQFFLKNVHPEMRNAAFELLGQPFVQSKPNVFGELMKVMISPSGNVEEAVKWVLGGGADPDIVLHMRMLMSRSGKAVHAALKCIKKAIESYKHQIGSRPRVVLLSDTPSLIEYITPLLQEFTEVLHFDYEIFQGNVSDKRINGTKQLDIRTKDWGPAPRWVAFVDFFLASRIGTTYAQLIAALAAAHQLREENSSSINTMRFTFLSSFQSNLLVEGLKNQAGWGHVWNRFAGTLSCSNQTDQCAHTPLLPPGWWDADWQSPHPRDISKLNGFGVKLTSVGQINEKYLHSFCKLRKDVAKTVPVFSH